jgi:hypothetical protein
MKFDLDLDNAPKTHISFYRNWFTGRLEIKANGELVASRSVLNPLTHFSVNLTRTYSFVVDGEEITVVKVRPLLFAGFRPHKYVVLRQGVQIAEYQGY